MRKELGKSKHGTFLEDNWPELFQNINKNKKGEREFTIFMCYLRNLKNQKNTKHKKNYRELATAYVLSWLLHFKRKKHFQHVLFIPKGSPTPLLSMRQAPWQEYICSLFLNNIFNLKLTTIQKVPKYRPIKIRKKNESHCHCQCHFSEVACVHSPAHIL